MNNLGIRMEQDVRQSSDPLEPEYPLLAACYSRFGLMRLSVKKHGGKRTVHS